MSQASLLPLSYPTRPKRLEHCSSQLSNHAPTQQQVLNSVSGAGQHSKQPLLVSIPGPKLGWHCCRTGTGTPPGPMSSSAYTVLLFQQRRPGIHIVLHVKTRILSAIYTQIPAHGMPCKDIFLTIKKSIYFNLRETDFLPFFCRAGKKIAPSAPVSKQEMLNLTPHDRINNS